MKRAIFLTPDLRTAESIGIQTKIGYKTRFVYFGSPNQIRTGVLALKGRCPRPLDDGAKTAAFLIQNAAKL